MKLSNEQGEALVRLACQTILGEFDLSCKGAPVGNQIETMEIQPIFRQCCGTFVTLKKQENLRGCIGNLISDRSITEGVQSNARNAAFHDHRFQPLSREELELLTVEVSVLTTPERLDFKDHNDLLRRLRVGVDGVILKKGILSATFLPQVWKQLPHAEIFLSQLCMKAGLSNSEWKNNTIKVETYQVQCFSGTFIDMVKNS